MGTRWRPSLDIAFTDGRAWTVQGSVPSVSVAHCSEVFGAAIAPNQATWGALKLLWLRWRLLGAEHCRVKAIWRYAVVSESDLALGVGKLAALVDSRRTAIEEAR